jgi:indole-3-glycerol phosphate synthase
MSVRPEPPAPDYLGPILARKRAEIARRIAHARLASSSRAQPPFPDRARAAVTRLRRGGSTLPRVIAEIKLRSPSAGTIRERTPGSLAVVAHQYEAAGAAAVSVLCDGRGFGGSPLDLRRIRVAVGVPLLFKEFVLDPIQIGLARTIGADMVLLLVRAMDEPTLRGLCDEVLALGMAPVVEAADETELEIALRTSATIIGVNARDLRTFRVDPERAKRAIERIPSDRVAVHMSGIRSGDALAELGGSRADAVLVGEALMRAPSPGERLEQWLDAARRR